MSCIGERCEQPNAGIWCRECSLCYTCADELDCDCIVGIDDFDADELGLDPEEDYA